MSVIHTQPILSLNPCSNGRYSRREEGNRIPAIHNVLILVLMEDALGAYTATYNLAIAYKS